jgi:hypothetical protein
MDGVMSLAARLASKFRANIRHRGAEYYLQHRVHIVRGSASELSANVIGSRTYEVALNFSKGRLSVWCECPHFADNGKLCKHLWATIVEAERSGYLHAPASAKAVAVDFDDHDFKHDLGHEPAAVAPSAALPVAGPSLIPLKNSQARKPSWQQRINHFLAPTEVAYQLERWRPNDRFYTSSMPRAAERRTDWRAQRKA